MNSWIGALASPSLFLAELSGAYALVPWACERGTPAVLHALLAVTLALCAVVGFFTWRVALPDVPGKERVQRWNFASILGLALTAITY